MFICEGTNVRSHGDAKSPTGIVIDEEVCSLVNELDGDCLFILDPQGNKIHTVGDIWSLRDIILDPKHSSM